VDSLGTTRHAYDAAGQLLAEDGPFTSDTVKGSVREIVIFLSRKGVDQR
jgi:hypothetical protein